MINLDISDHGDVLESVKEVDEFTWMDLGTLLGIRQHTLRQIQGKYRGCVERCKSEMLETWLQGEKNAKEQTWSTLVIALKEMQRKDLAERIEQEHQFSKSPIDWYMYIVT